MNLVDGTVSGGSVEIAAGERLPLPPSASVAEGQRVTSGVRPEDVDIGGDGPQALVEVVEPTGPDTQLLLTMGEVSLVALLRRRETVCPGQQLSLMLDPDKVHLFDRDSGSRISA